jgi:hypothetical protein
MSMSDDIFDSIINLVIVLIFGTLFIITVVFPLFKLIGKL